MNATLPNPVKDAINPPSMPGEWSLNQIIQALSRPLPKTLLATRKQGVKSLVIMHGTRPTNFWISMLRAGPGRSPKFSYPRAVCSWLVRFQFLPVMG